MKITDARTFVVGNPPPHFGGQYFLFVKLTTDSGVHGYGEAYSIPFHPRVAAQMIEDVCDRYVIGADPFKIESLWRIIYSSGYTQRPDTSLLGVLSAIEMACWDIVGKELDKPIYELLGGQVHERLRSYTYLYPQEGDSSDVYRDAELAARACSRVCGHGLHRGQVRPRGRVFGLRPAPAVVGGTGPRRELRAHGARGGGQPLRPAVRHTRPDDDLQRHPPGAAPGAVRPALV